MAMPNPVKITKKGVEYVSQVDRVQYTLQELVHAANKNVGKLVVQEARKTMNKKTGRGSKNTQYWAKKSREAGSQSKYEKGVLQVGYKNDGFYMGYQETGTNNQVKQAHIQNAVIGNKEEIRRIQGTFIKSIEDENKALGLINENEEVGNV